MAVVTGAVELDGILIEEPAGPDPKRLGLEQLTVAAGQLTAGAGNLAFTMVAARLLVPSDFARLSVFLGLFLVLSLPAASLSAATALNPVRRDLLLKRVTVAGVVLAAVGAVASPWLGTALHLSPGMVLVLCAAVPGAILLAIERGRLYGWQMHRRVVASLVAEPAVRLTVGVVLAIWSGAIGGAGGVVLASYLAVEVARRRRRPAHRARARRAPGLQPAEGGTGPEQAALGAAGWTAAAFALLALVQNQDLIFANALLPGSGAGLYAALSTLGGAAAFATLTVPMVLLPRAVRGDRNSLGVAVGMAAAMGAVVVAVGAVGSGALVRALFGAHYAVVGHLVAPYLGAMGLLGVARVLVAERCATGSARSITVLLVVVATLQAATITLARPGVDGIAMITLATTAGLTLLLGAQRITHERAFGPRLTRWAARAVYDPSIQPVALAMTVGLILRLIVWRGLWLDEATSVHQVHLGFSTMIANLRDTDVHPPLYFALLWATVRVCGYGSMAIRIPSILAGLLIIPAAYVAGRDLWDRRTGVVAAWLGAVAPLVVWYSQEVRMYSMFMLFAVLAIWGQGRVLRRGRFEDWAVYVLASAALAWTEYFGIFQIVAQQLFFLWILARGRREREGDHRLLVGWVLATAALLLVVVPLVPFAWHQFMVNQNAGKGFGAPSQTNLAGTQSLSVYTVLANLAWAVIGYHSAPIMEALVALWPIGILLTLFALGRRARRQTSMVLVAAVVPAVLLLGAGMEKRFLYDVRYMSGVVVALVLVGSRMVTGACRTRRLQVLGCAAIVAVLGAGLVDEQFNGTNPRLYDFSGALRVVDQEWRPGDVLVYSPSSLQLVIGYYAPRAAVQTVTPTPPEVPPGRNVFVLASPTLMTGNEPQQLQRVLTGLRQADTPGRIVRTSNVTVWTFVVPPGSRNTARPSARSGVRR